ncbi:MAG: hypothetical protein IT533_03545 [Hyphomicrobiales bacterium]|nr:hypothetical protein [Hyphomicrobiales bacterium]
MLPTATVRASLQKFLAMLRNQPASGSADARLRKESKGYSLHGSTGETVYGDRPLRFRSLTLTEADIPALDDPATADGFKIRISKLRPGRIQAGSLVQQRYAGRGYRLPGIVRQEPDLFTFIAYDEGNLMGTVGVRIDSPGSGLSADELYGEEISTLRSRGYRLCEFTRLAVDKTSASKPVLAGLFHTAYLFASLIRGSTHAVIEVNPRHVVFYRRALSFDVIGSERVSPRVNAPAVLLCVPFARIAEGLARFAGHPDDPSAGRSLFPYGFPPDEEEGVLRRLRELVRH